MDNNAENADINNNEDIDHEDLVLGYRLPRRRTNWRVRHDGLSQRQAATLRQLEASRSESKKEYEYVLLLIAILSAALATISRRLRLGNIAGNLVKVIQLLCVALAMTQQRHHSITDQMQDILFIEQ
jgi:hypothetical protein